MNPSRYFVIIPGLLLPSLSFSVSRVTTTPLLTTLFIDTPVYTVDFLTPSSNILPQAARSAIIEAMNSWTGSPPENNTFSLIGLRWEDDWGLATLTSILAVAPGIVTHICDRSKSPAPFRPATFSSHPTYPATR